MTEKEIHIPEGEGIPTPKSWDEAFAELKQFIIKEREAEWKKETTPSEETK